MTSTSTIRADQPRLEGRTVRDVVEYQHELVNEVWCRKILRQVLQSLELQYASGMPHRAITPDTIVLQENGEPMLLPSERKAAQQGIPADMHALACVIHYAITLELAPAGPLRGRGLTGYSDSLTGAIDKCLAPDPARRPQTIDELRNLLGIVSLGPPVAVAAPRDEPPPGAERAPAAVLPPEPAPAPRRSAPLGKLQRWMLIGLAALVLLAAVMALMALLRGTASRDAVVLTLPPQGTAPATNEQAMPPPAPRPAAEAPAPSPQPALEAAAPTALPPAPAPSTAPAPSAAPAPARAATPPSARPARAATEPASTSYKLVIKPWANVYVDGVERGVSPPLKRLSLPAGQHTVRLVNPSFPDRVIRVDAGKSQYGTIVFNFAPR